MMSAPRQACRWRCYHEHCLAATEAAAAPRHHLYTALRRDTARVRSLLSRGDAALSDAQDAATRRKSVENWMAVGQSLSNHQLKYTFDVQIVVVVKIDITCLYHIHENWSRLRIIILWQNWKHHEHSSWCNPTYSPLSPSSSDQCHNIGLESVLLGPIWHLTAPTSNIHQLKIPHRLLTMSIFCVLLSNSKFQILTLEAPWNNSNKIYVSFYSKCEG